MGAALIKRGGNPMGFTSKSTWYIHRGKKGGWPSGYTTSLWGQVIYSTTAVLSKSHRVRLPWSREM